MDELAKVIGKALNEHSAQFHPTVSKVDMIANAVRSFLLSEERVDATSEAIKADLARQDGSEGTWILDHGKLAFIDQNDVDMRSLARAALTAAIGEGK